MTKSEMIDALLNAHPGDPDYLMRRRSRLSRMSVSMLEREMLYRGLAAYEDPESVEFDEKIDFSPSSVLDAYFRESVVE